MDKSETYIKMCDCEEIQKLYKTEKENFLEYNPNCDDSHLPVWLPRQDQLQEIIEPIAGYPNNLVCDFWEWFDECNGIDNDIAFTSMEQLWLAFAMKKQYNKVWDGGNWVS